MGRQVLRAFLLVCVMTVAACDETPPSAPSPTGPPPGPGGNLIADDAALFRLVTQTEAFAGYTLFPNADPVTTGTLTGSNAHRPMIRVSLNARALGVLQNGRLPSGARFPDGSVVFKEILGGSGGTASAYAVMYKAGADTRAGNGWLWAEFSPGGAVGYSITNRGSACTACHQLDQGPQNDSVRTFERQR